MFGFPRRIAATTALLCLTFGASACSEKTRDSANSSARAAVTDARDVVAGAFDAATETAIRNIATRQGEQQFAKSGYPLDGQGLACKATVTDGVAHVTVLCLGNTKAGVAGVLSGETSEIPGASVTELEGTFVGTVDGKQVFTTKKLGG